ncbi:MAG: fibronectin type III domain-containing protein [Sterolibacterium sp.]|jgi:alpha-tubulin suppressor-like RCC1 family protein
MSQNATTVRAFVLLILSALSLGSAQATQPVLSAGYETSAVVRLDGSLWVWGDNSKGQIGDGTIATPAKSSPVKIGTGYKSVVAAEYFTIGLKDDGSLYAWGLNSFGIFGDKKAVISSPTPKLIGSGYASVAAGLDFVVGIKTDGSLWTWGSNSFGELGATGRGTLDSPQQISHSGEIYAAVSADQYHALALRTDGSLWGWGNNTNGQLGLGTKGSNVTTPTLIGQGYSAVSTFYSHTLALKGNSVYAWGANTRGVFGDGTGTESLSPKLLAYTYQTISTGSYHTVALGSDGTLAAWGLNSYGNLGDGTVSDVLSPKNVDTGQCYTAISAGGNHSIALNANGGFYAWGDNTKGEVGDGSSTNVLSPKFVLADIPGSPTNATATAGRSQATLSFSAPTSTGGIAISGYAVTSNPSGGVDSNGGTTGLTHTVTGLKKGTSYTFTVTATNAEGTGAPSATSNSVIPFDVPDAPTIGAATPGIGSANVTFTAPANSGGLAISGYTVTCGSSAATGTSSPITVTGLTNGTAYSCSVTASNSVGASTPSGAVSVTPFTIPDAPTNVAAVPGNGQAAVSFSAPGSNGGSPISGYTVTAMPGNIVASGTASPITVTGLSNGVSYSFTVTAANAAGMGAASSPSTSVSPAPLASALSVSISGTGSGSVASNPGGINCTQTCGASFYSGVSATLTATPSAGSSFAGWSGDCTGTGTCTVVMSAPRAVTASFTPTAKPSPEDCFFNWAETTYPQLFAPAGSASVTLPPYYFRFYSGTGNYLATSTADNHTWVLGTATAGALLDIGATSSFTSMAGCSP